MKRVRPFNVILSLSLFCGGVLSSCSFEFNKTFDEDASPGTGNGTLGPDTGTITADTVTDTVTGSDATDTGATTADTATETTDTATETIDTVTEIATDTWTVTSGTLVHRWRFDGDMTDELGVSDAKIVTPEGAAGGNATLSDSEITLSGGAFDEAEWVSLGSHLLTNIDGPFTIEIFATQLGVEYFSRIFQFGSDRYNYLNMTWTVDNNLDRDAVIWWGGGDMLPAWDTNAPYTIGEEYHIVMTVDPDGGTDGGLHIAWYSAQSSAANMGGERGSFEPLELLTGVNDTGCWLGKSHSDDDRVANASYSDMRIWSGALSKTDVESLHDLGPDM